MGTPAVQQLDDSCFKTPAVPDIANEDPASARRRLQMGLEKMRAENRARARLKSDEELCLAASSRSGARYRSSSLREQVLARTKSHDVLSPRNSDTRATTADGILEENEPLKRKTLSEELATAKSTAARRPSTPESDDATESIPAADASPTSPVTPSAKPKPSFLSKLLNSFSPPPAGVTITQATPSPSKAPVAASESNKETSLLSKIGWKYGPNKRRSRGSLSPQQSLEKSPEEPTFVRETSPLANPPKPSGKSVVSFWDRRSGGLLESQICGQNR